MSCQTALYSVHKALKAKMGEFAGYDMPLYYDEGVIREHEWVRSHAGIFDVSHMGQIIIKGEGVADFLERLTPSAFENKENGKAQYTVLTNEQGGIIDDLIITRMAEDTFFLVVNAGRKEKDIAWIKKHLPDTLSFEYLEDRALLALQGPEAERVMKDAMEADLSDLPYMRMIETKAPCGTDIFVSRVGYTGEDGFEISVPDERAEDAWTMLTDHKAVKPIGLAARDSLRLEMGYALYGHDIDETTSPVEADISWIISKTTDGYFGCERIQNERENGPRRKRIGFKITGKGIAREGAEIQDLNGQKIGAVTSGGFSPNLKHGIGQGYVDTPHAKAGERVSIIVRGRPIAAELAALPLVPAKTKSMKKKAA